MTEVTSEEPIILLVSDGAAALRVDSWVASQMPDVTRAAVQRWIADDRILVDGKPCRSKDRLRVGSRIEVFPDEEPATDAVADPSVLLNVVFEDEHLLVVDKPPGLVVHPGRGHRTGTLVNGLLARPGFERPAPDPLDPAGQLRPGIVHRIDKETSGLLVVAKDSKTREGLKRQLAEHSVDREYVAICIGVPLPGRIETLHGRDPRSRLRFSSQVTSGKVAITHVEVLEALASRRGALISCRLETGRTHQIRVHLSGQCSSPLLADSLYGGFRGDPEIIEIAKTLGRQALHARQLGFVHPITDKRILLRSEMPADMTRAWSQLKKIG